MSEYLSVETSYEDEQLLREAVETVAQELGIQAEVHEQGQEEQLYGYSGDLRQQTGQFIVRRRFVGRSSNDVGWTRKDDGSYELLISAFDNTQQGSRKIVEEVDMEYKRRLVERQVRKSARFRGAKVQTTRTSTGAVQVQIVMRG